MTQSRLKSLSVAVDAAGLKYKLFADGIMVDTNYDGPYAPSETWDKINLLRAICRRRNLAGESRGHHTGFYIHEIA